MASDELDLEKGDASRASSREERRSRRTSSTTAARKTDNEVDGRLHRTFERIAAAREARGDEELADVIREDSDAMAQGFTSLTANVPFLRMPLIMGLNILEPALAFSRVGGILLGRFFERRQRRAMEAAAARGEVDGEFVNNGGSEPYEAAVQ